MGSSADLAGFPLLRTLLSKSFDPENPAALNTILSTLSEADQKALLPLLDEPALANPLTAAEETLSTLSRRHLKSQLDIKLNALSDPALSPEKQAILQKEILDLQAILKDISAWFWKCPPRGRICHSHWFTKQHFSATPRKD